MDPIPEQNISSDDDPGKRLPSVDELAKDLAEAFPRIPIEVHKSVAENLLARIRSPEEVEQAVKVAEHNEKIDLIRRQKLMTRKAKNRVIKGRGSTKSKRRKR